MSDGNMPCLRIRLMQSADARRDIHVAYLECALFTFRRASSVFYCLHSLDISYGGISSPRFYNLGVRILLVAPILVNYSVMSNNQTLNTVWRAS